MKNRALNTATPVLVTGFLLGAIGLAAPAAAQKAATTTGTGEPQNTLNAGNTGVGPRGTAVAPSTQPGADTGNTMASSQTGTPPRGTATGPSTQPGANQKQNQ